MRKQNKIKNCLVAVVSIVFLITIASSCLESDSGQDSGFDFGGMGYVWNDWDFYSGSYNWSSTNVWPSEEPTIP